MTGEVEHIVRLADRRVDLVRQAVVFPDGSTKNLTTRETQLLGYLSRRPEEDVSRDELLEQVWEYRANYATRAVDVAMRRLRAKVEPDPQNPVHLIAVHGVGYRYVPPPEAPLAMPPVRDSPSPDLPRSNLRPERSSFVGRAAQLEQIEALLAGDARVVSLLGPGGIGKTRLATRFAAEHLDDWPGGVWLCELSAAEGLAGVAATVGAVLGVPLTGGQDSMVETLGAALDARGRVLLLLDGFEHVVNKAREALGVWVERAPGARFLITSEERLRIAGEHAVEVGPLSVEEARELFVDRVEASGASLKRDDTQSIDRIVDRLDRLPLAIELAAPRARVLSLEQLHDRLDQRFKVLSWGRGSGGALRHAIDWSWGLLSEPQQRALAWCSTFSGGFTLDAAEAVLQDTEAGPWVLDLVEALRDKSLIHAYEPAEQPGDVRFALYESIRDYAAERLLERREVEAAEARHAAYYLELGAELAEGIDQRGGLDDLRCLAAEVDNLLAVVRRRRRAHPGEGIAAVGALGPALTTRGAYPLYQRLLDDAVADAEASGVEPIGLARLLVERAGVHRVRAQMEAASEDLGRAMQLSRESGSLVEIEALMGLALVSADQSRLDEAEAMAQLALELARDRHHRDQQGTVLGMLAAFATMRGRPEVAERQYLEAIRLLEGVGNDRRAGLSNANLGLLLLEFGRIGEAEERILAALRIHGAWDDRRRYATDLMGLALLRGGQRRYAEAVEHAEEALQRFREIGYTRFAAHATQNLAALRWAMGDAQAAVPLFFEAIERFQAVGDRLSESMAQSYLGAALATTGDLVGGIRSVDRADELLKGLFSRQASGIAVVARGFVELARARAGHVHAAALQATARQKAEDGLSSPLFGIQFIAGLLLDELQREPQSDATQGSPR